METSSSCPAYQFAGYPVARSQGVGAGGGGGCLLVILLVLFVGVFLWMCSAARNGRRRNCAAPILHGDAQYKGVARDMRCGIPESEVPGGAQDMSREELRKRASQTAIVAPITNAASGINNSIGRVPFTPNLGLPTPDEVIGSRAVGSTPFQSSAFAPSEVSAEFYATFQPSSLSQMMPANWRPSGQNCGAVAAAQAGASPVDANFDEFSRYTVAPSQVQKAETLRGTIRLAEITNTRNSRTLGEPSLLRNAVTPLSPIPIGSTAFPWMDSQMRQGFIAASTGRYPEDIGC